jgi:hypothetical protein
VTIDTDALLAGVRHEVSLIRTAVGIALAEKNIPHVPQWTQLTPASLERIDAALDALAAEITELKRQLESVERFLASPPGPDYYPAGIHWMRDRTLS